MSVPRLDPRSNVDRIYQYGEYQTLSATFKRRKPRGIFRFVPAPLATRLRQRSAVRMLPFKLTLVCGMLASLLGLGAMAYFSADNVRLAYAKDELETSISGLNQSMAEEADTDVGVVNENGKWPMCDTLDDAEPSASPSTSPAPTPSA